MKQNWLLIAAEATAKFRTACVAVFSLPSWAAENNRNSLVTMACNFLGSLYGCEGPVPEPVKQCLFLNSLCGCEGRRVTPTALPPFLSSLSGYEDCLQIQLLAVDFLSSLCGCEDQEIAREGLVAFLSSRLKVLAEHASRSSMTERGTG
ncbi:TPA: hypothetical protein P2Q89_004204 [Aeromonas veronii]|nr:hypothetical protein [Aeromonas veronii]